jgi:hypothetical protein
MVLLGCDKTPNSEKEPPEKRTDLNNDAENIIT